MNTKTIILKIVASCLFVWLMMGCSKSEAPARVSESGASRVAESIGHLKNSDVQWDGTYNGLDVRLNESAKRVLATIAEEEKRGEHSTRKQLVTLLEDPERFVVGHVLLTRTAFGEKISISGSDWNGLKVDIDKDGKARVDAAQRVAILNHWRSEKLLN